MWQSCTTYHNEFTTSHVISGELVTSEDEHTHSSNKEIKSHLAVAWVAINECNAER